MFGLPSVPGPEVPTVGPTFGVGASYSDGELSISPPKIPPKAKVEVLHIYVRL